MAIDQIVTEILRHDTIIIHRHVRPDPDAYGSQVGLKLLIEHSFPDKQVYAVGEEEVSLHFLARMDDIPDEYYEEALVIVCDTANTERICDERFQQGKQLIKIDHHPNEDPYGDVLWVDPAASSTSEMIYELYEKAVKQGMKMNDEAARLLYAGIVGDTGRFLFPSTTERTFQIAAKLMKYSFELPPLYRNLYDVQAKIAKLKGYILQEFTLSPAGVSTVKFSKEILQKFTVEPSETGKLVSVLGDIEGIKAWAFFIEEEEGMIRVRIRSKGPVINKLAAQYRGGGHPLASGATVSTWEEADQLTEDLEKLCKE